MGKTPSFSTVYGKNEKGQRVAIGIKLEGGIFLKGVRHPAEVRKATKPKSTTESKKTITKKLGLGRKSKKQ